MEEKEITTFKPGTALYIFLFIFYTIWLLQAFGAVGFYIEFGFDDFNGYGLMEWLIMPLFCFAGIYSVYAVIKVLRGDRDCITALKWALMYSFLYTFFNSQRAQIPTYSIVAILSMFLARPLFYLTFYFYLCFSKGIRRRYPKVERRFTPSGWVWSVVTICLVGICGYMSYKTHLTNRFCEKVDLKDVTLSPGEISDGYVAFKSNKHWSISKEHLDTVFIEDKMFCEQTMETSDTIYSIILFSGRSDKRDVRTHNQVLTRFFGQVEEDIIESDFTDTIANSKRLIATTFKTKTDVEGKTFTIATLFDFNSPKCIVLAAKVKCKDDGEWLNEILTTLRFDLKGTTDTEDKKGSNDEKNKISNRVSYRYQKTDANMLAGFLNGRTPGFPFGEMLLEHHKREITNSQGYYPLY